MAASHGIWPQTLRDRPFGRRCALCRHSSVATVVSVYLLSGLAASLAAIIYVAHLGQAKSDAGTGYELMAITAVVLGGASIFGGRGTVLGTVLGLFAIVVLQNGLRLSAQPAELGGHSDRRVAVSHDRSRSLVVNCRLSRQRARDATTESDN